MYGSVVWELTLNRPRVLNALNRALKGELADALTRIKSDESIRAVVITGAGEQAFSAAQDLTEAKDMMSRGLYLVLSGDSLDAGQAQQAGLTIKVVPPGLRPILRARASRVLRGKGRQARDGGVF